MNNWTQTTFYKDNGQISSTRVTSGNRKNGVSYNSYMGSSRGGITFYNNSISTRFNNKGQSMNTNFGVKPF